MWRRAARSHGWLLRAEACGEESEHLLNLLCGVVLVSAEDIGFGAFGVTEFMNMGLTNVSKTNSPQSLPK